MISMQIIPKGFEDAEKKLTAAGKNFSKAANDACLRGLKHGRTVADRLIRERYAIQKKDVMPKLRVEFDPHGGKLEATGPMLPVSLFKPTQTKKGVKVKILKGRGKGVIEGAFLKKGRVWQRRGRERFPIKIVSTAGIPLMTSVKPVSDKIQKAIEVETTKRMASNVERALAGKAFK